MNVTRPLGDPPDDPAGDKTEPVRIPNLPPPDQSYQPPYQPPYQQPYQQPYQPPGQTPYLQSPNLQAYHQPAPQLRGSFGQLALGRKVVLVAALLAIISFFLPWYRVGVETIDQEVLSEMSERERNQAGEDLEDLFGASTLRNLDDDELASTGGLTGIFAFLSFLSLMAAAVAAALPLTGRRLHALVALPLPESLILLALVGLSLLLALISVFVTNSAFIAIGLGFYMTLIALLAASAGAALLLTSGE